MNGLTATRKKSSGRPPNPQHARASSSLKFTRSASRSRWSSYAEHPGKRQRRFSCAAAQGKMKLQQLGFEQGQRAEVVFGEQSAGLLGQQANHVGHGDAIHRVDLGLKPPAPGGRLVGDAAYLRCSPAEPEQIAQLAFVHALDDRAGQVGGQVVAHDLVEHRTLAGEQVGPAQSDVALGVQAVELEKKLQARGGARPIVRPDRRCAATPDRWC